LNPLGFFLEPPGPLLTHLHTVYMAYSERLPTRLNPLAERTCFSQVFGLREKGCEKTGDCFITEAMCNEESIKGKSIDHSITVVGFGAHPKNGDYWIIKNSWSENFANGGYINVARGVKCASMCSSAGICGHLFAAGDPAAYYEQ
jgi:hypothetical protein